MGNTARFSALNTKLRAMKTQLLSMRDYEALFALSSTVEISRYLCDNTVYREILKDRSLKDIHRGELEILLRNHGIERLQGLENFMEKEYRDFLKAILFRYEVENLHILLRGVSQARPAADIRSKLFHIRSYLDIDFESLLYSKTVEEVIERFEGSILEAALRNVTAEDVQTREFHIEMNTDYVYFENLIRKAEKLSKEDRDIALEVIGLFVDVINGGWIYRAKLNYSISDEEILNYSLQGGDRLTFNVMKQLVYSANFVEDFEDFFRKKYRGLDEDSVVHDQRFMDRYIMKRLMALNQNHPMSIAALMEFVHSLEYENLNMITVIEGAKYNQADKWEYLIPTSSKMRKEGGGKIWRLKR